MANCAICNEAIKSGATALADGLLICEDCLKYSALIRECEGCYRDFHAASLHRTEGGIYCEDCIQESVKEMDFKTWDDWLTACEEDETPEDETVEAWLEWHEDAWESVSEKDPHKKIMRKMLAEEIENEDLKKAV